jgi:hypothetical protein
MVTRLWRHTPVGMLHDFHWYSVVTSRCGGFLSDCQDCTECSKCRNRVTISEMNYWMRDFRFPPTCKWYLRSSGMLTQRRLVVSYRRLGTTCRSHRQGSRVRKPLDNWRWDRHVVLKLRWLTSNIRCVTFQKSEDLINRYERRKNNERDHGV